MTVQFSPDKSDGKRNYVKGCPVPS